MTDPAATTRMLTELAQAVDPRLTVREVVGHGHWVVADERGIVQLGDQGLRLLPAGDWEQVELEDPQQHQLIMDRIRGAVVSGGDGAVPSSTSGAWLEALRTRGVPASVRGGVVVVDGFGVLRPPPEGASRSKAAKRFVLTETSKHSRELVAAARKALGSYGNVVSVAPKNKRVHVSIGHKHVASLTRYALHVDNKLVASGDFLKRPSLLGVLRKAVAPHVRRLGAAPATRERRGAPTPTSAQDVGGAGRRASRDLEVRLRFPEDLPAGARERALEASARVRLERRLVPAVTVQVITARGTITFGRVRERSRGPEVPFVFEDRLKRFEAALRLVHRTDPLPLIYDPAAGAVLAEAWASAIVVYAELTCTDVEEDAPTQERKLRRGGRSASIGSNTYRTARSLRSPRGHAQPATFTSFRDAIRNLHSVAGHLRRLPPGETASIEQVRAAEAVGIRVPSGYTWVRPHVRDAGTVRVVWPRAKLLW